MIDQRAVAEISICGVKDRLSWKSICLIICSCFGEVNMLLTRCFIKRMSFGVLERQASFCIL